MKVFALAIALALSLLPAQDKVTLRFNPKQGDKLVKTEKSELSVKAKIVAGGQEQELEFEQRESEQTTLEFAEAADGKVTRAVLSCKECVEEKKGPPSGQWEKKEKPLHGRKITMSMKDGAMAREGADGIDAKTLAKLDLQDRTSRIFPKDPVGPGDAWEIQGDEVRKFLAVEDDVKNAKVKMKFDSVKEIDGKRCAVLNAALELSGKTEEGIDLAMKLDAEVVIWIERGYALSVKGKGTMSMKGENDQFKMSGQGPISLAISTKVE